MNLQEVLTLDFAFLDTFTNRIDTAWGSIFYNEDQPNYYDSNHSLISDAPGNPQLVIDEVIHFYNSRNIIPRFYLYNVDHMQNFLSELKSKGFKYEEITNPVQLWNNRIIGIEHNPKATIEKVTAENVQEALEIECSIKEFGGKNAVEKVFLEQFNHPAFTHYLLRYDNKACSTACVFEHDQQARMESVATLEAFRGKGLIGEVIQSIQIEISSKNIEKLWVLPISERVEKVYQKYGFQTVAKLKTGHSYLGGKGINEIQGR